MARARGLLRMPERRPLREHATMASECELQLRGRPSGGNRWRARGKAETGQESLDDLLLGDHRKDLTPSVAARTFQDIKFEHTLHQVMTTGSWTPKKRSMAPIPCSSTPTATARETDWKSCWVAIPSTPIRCPRRSPHSPAQRGSCSSRRCWSAVRRGSASCCGALAPSHE